MIAYRTLFLWVLVISGGLSGFVPAARSASPETVKIYKNTGALQCGKPGIPLGLMEKALRANGIEVTSSSCGSDGYLYPAVCGGRTGSISVYEIKIADLPNAISLGFKEFSKLPKERGGDTLQSSFTFKVTMRRDTDRSLLPARHN